MNLEKLKNHLVKQLTHFYRIKDFQQFKVKHKGLTTFKGKICKREIAN